MNAIDVTDEMMAIKKSLVEISRVLSELEPYFNKYDLIDCLKLSEKRLLSILTWEDGQSLELACKVNTDSADLLGKRRIEGSSNLCWDDMSKVFKGEVFRMLSFFNFAPFESFGDFVLVSNAKIPDEGLLPFNTLDFFMTSPGPMKSREGHPQTR